MAITRIKNNQITNATIDAGTKLVDASITAGKLANDLNYGSNLTITGNLTVNGSSTTLDTVNTIIEDPILLLGKDQTGVPAYDLGFVGERGDENNAVFIWKEDEGEFQFGTTTGTGDGTTVTLAGFADMQAAGITGTTLSLSGNITGPLNVTGAIEASTSITAGTTVTATGNVAGGNITTAGAVEATGLISSGSTITATGNVAGGNITTAGAMEATGLISSGTTITATGNVAGGNITTVGAMDSATINTTGEATLASAIVSDLTDGRVVLAGTSGAIEDSANMTFDGSTLGVTGAITASTTITATGNVTGGNLTTGGDVTTVTVTASGAIAGSTTITATGNVAGGNITTAGAVEATGLISSGTTITATGNITGGNIGTAGQVTATGNVNGGNIISAVFNGAAPTLGATGTDSSVTLAPTGTGSVDVSSKKITSLATPTASTDAANKGYVDSIAEGLDIKASCVVATTAVLPAVTYANGTDGVGATLTADANGAFAAIDGVTVTTVGARILVKNQATQLQNGIYQLSTVGDAGAAFVLTRTTDFDNGSPSGEIPGAFTFIEEGTTNADNGFVCTTNAPVTVGTTAIVWVQFSGAGQIEAGDGLAKTGDVLSVNVDDVTTAISGDAVIVKTSANLTTPNIGVANGDSFTASGIVTATGNVTGGNLTTGGDVTTVTVTASGAIAGSTTITATGNVAGGNLTTTAAMDSATINTTGEATLASAIVSDLTDGRVVLAGTSGAIEDSANMTFDGSTLGVTGAITASTTITATGNVAGGNITTAGAVEATGLISSGSTITATGNITGGNLTTGGDVTTVTVTASGAIAGSTTITATGNVAGGNITTAGRVDATGAVSGASVTAGNVTVNTDSIDSAGTAITLNTDSSDVDIIIENAAGNAYVKADAGASSVTIGENATATTGATLKVGGTDSAMIPVGTSAERPGTPATGMIRLNTTLDSFEFYDSNSWTTAGSDFTVIASETFNGDNSTVAFTLSTSQTTASCIVSINGVVQLPTDAYGVSGTTLTFTEAPLAGDVIEVREITTTSTITYLSNAQATASMEALDGQAIVQIKGDLNPIANATQDLGSASSRWNELFLSGSTITLGNVVIKNTGGNSVGFFGPDGTTPGTIDANVEIAGDSIQNGTSLVDFSGSGGDVQITAGGTQSLTVISTGANVAGDFATTGDVRFLDSDNSNYVGFQAPATVGTNLVWTLPAADAGVSGYALVSDASGTLSFAAAGATVTSDTTTNAELLLYVAATTTGALTAVTQDSGLTYNPSTGSLSSAVFIGDLTGTADAATLAADATKLATTRAIEVSGAVTGTANFDGSAAINIVTTATSDPTITLGGDLSGAVTLTNLASGTLTATVGTLNQNTTGSAATLTTARAIEVSGAVTGTADFDGSAAINIVTTATSDPTITLAGDLSGSVTLTNLASGTLTATLTKDPVITLTGAVTGSGTMTNLGSVSIATTNTADPTITLGGDLTGSVTLTNLASGTLTATIAANSVALGTDTTGNYVGTGAVSGVGLSGSASGEGATFTVTSNATSANTASTIVARDGSGNFTAGVITATATAARYADLAEIYASDGDIEAGTVVHFAGEGKVAECDIANCRSVAGIVSTDPAYLMNSDADGVALAIAGRVPTKVTGVIAAGDLIVSAGNGRGMANNDAAIGTVIGKAIEANEGGDGVIEVLALMM
jgi:hypothetical protein